MGRVVDLSRVEPTDVFMDLRLVRLGEDLASSEIDEKATLVCIIVTNVLNYHISDVEYAWL